MQTFKTKAKLYFQLVTVGPFILAAAGTAAIAGMIRAAIRGELRVTESDQT